MALTRVDQLLVERGVVESRHKARAMIMAGEVLVAEQKASKPGQRVETDAEIRLIRQPPPYVSRGGVKLAAALDRYSTDVQDIVCLDIGSSTGGFTDCLLQRGARRVHAVDVGTGQLHWKLRQDDRVATHERLNARYLDESHLGERVGLVTCDVSFISVTKILPCFQRVLVPGAEGVILAKPQFEVGKGQVGKGGVVRDPEQHRAVVEMVSAAMLEAGFADVDWCESPIRGASGNREFLVHGRNWSVRTEPAA